ncbi:MAG TPA: hypothetical protein ENK06_11000 [Gammaproteobacteria bacterium]|nr:hypothetical protein [Gammaproteobacteria bacterium]
MSQRLIILFYCIFSFPLLAFATEDIFQPESVRYWAGPQSEHQLKPDQAKLFKQFPFSWEDDIFNRGEAWYEFDIPDARIPLGLAGILIPRVYLNANVYLNQQLIGSGGSMTPPIAKNAHRPLYFTIPHSAWLPTGNKIQIQHMSYANMGYILGVQVSSDTVLYPVFQQRYWKQQTLPKILFIVEVLAMLLIFSIWLVRRSQIAYLWFSLSLMMLSLVTLNHFLIDTQMPHKIWATINNTAIDWWLVFLNLFVFSRLNLNNFIFKRVLFAYALLSLLYYIALPLNELPGTLLFHSIGFAILIFTLGYLLYLRFVTRLAATPYLLLYTALTIIGVHDLLLQLGLFNDGQFILYFAAPLSVLLIVGHIINEFISAMRQSEKHATHLQETVNQVKSELDAQYQMLRLSSNQHVKMAERERIYRDLHDDVGAKLLSLYYRADDEQSGHLAKSALQDLRDIVSRKSMDGETLKDAIEHWRNECYERSNEYAIQLNWYCNEIDSTSKLSELQYMHLSRMLREALSNALRHAPQIQSVSVTIVERQQQLFFHIQNDGVTAPVTHWQRGRGLNNIFIRAQELQGAASIKQISETEVSVDWHIPRALS